MPLHLRVLRGCGAPYHEAARLAGPNDATKCTEGAKFDWPRPAQLNLIPNALLPGVTGHE
jgi:hypothetical protein